MLAMFELDQSDLSGVIQRLQKVLSVSNILLDCKQSYNRIMEATPESSTPIRAASSYTSVSLHDAVKLRLSKQGLAAEPPETIPQFFAECCEKYAAKTAFCYKSQDSENGEYVKVTFAEYAEKVDHVALMLLHVGLQQHSSVGILAHNCPEWFYAELAAFKAGGVVAGIYVTSSPDAVAHVLDTSDATICIVDTAEQMAKVRSVKGRLPRLRAVIQLQPPYDENFGSSEEGYYRWEDLEAMEFEEDLKQELERRESDVCANECALLVYTSGTTGMPKGAMLSHDSLLYDAKAFFYNHSFFQTDNERIVSYLPLNHVVAQVFDVLLSMLTGACMWFADRNAFKGSLFKTFQEVKPTTAFCVPRICEKLQENALKNDTHSTFLTKCVSELAKRTVEQYYTDQINKKPPSKFKYWIASKVTHQIKVSLGLDCCKTLFVAGAPCSEEVKRFFLSIDLPLSELYGMTECSGAASVNSELVNLQTVGKSLEGIELKIDNPDCNGHGEICIRGRSVFMGYLNEINKTKETIKEDGFLYSGDLGYLDTNGYLYVTGRIKEIIITAGGENIPPVYVEESIKQQLNAISNVLLVGDRRKYLTVLITLKTEFDANSGLPTDILRSETIEWLESLGIFTNRLSEVLNLPVHIEEEEAINTIIELHPKVKESIEQAIKRANAFAQSNAQKVQKFALLPHDFSAATGEIGTTLKVRRTFVVQKYAKIIERLYQ